MASKGCVREGTAEVGNGVADRTADSTDDYAANHQTHGAAVDEVLFSAAAPEEEEDDEWAAMRRKMLVGGDGDDDDDDDFVLWRPGADDDESEEEEEHRQAGDKGRRGGEQSPHLKGRGVESADGERVLIHLHGGGFV